jgi:hypothetical protein
MEMDKGSSRIAWLAAWAIYLTLGLLPGCGGGSPPAAAQQPKPKPSAAAKKRPAFKAPPASTVEKPTPRQRPPERTLADLVPKTEEKAVDPLRFSLPEVDEAKCRARGIRKLTSDHLILYTDVPSSPAVDELPHVFDLALPQWLAYFGIEAKHAEKWQMVGVLADKKERFVETGLWPADLPPFLHGYMRDRQFWLYDQPSDFYRRHLLLHEGTHGFMWNFLAGLGPPWYAEGMAELLGTHDWTDGKLTLGVIPPSKEASPLWGRVKVLKDGFAANSALQLREIMSYPPEAHLKTEPYAWCWAAAVFFDHDPKYQKIFREAPQTVADVTQQFSERLLNRLSEPREQVSEQWQCFVANIDYGYDVARESIIRRDSPTALPAAGATIAVAADRGWQSTGHTLAAGQTYQLTASGRFQIGKSTKPWMSEAGGITLKYHKGQPIGMLLAAVSDEGKSGRLSPLVKPQAIGERGEIKPDQEGVLYLRVNDSPAELADNAGELKVDIHSKE